MNLSQIIDRRERAISRCNAVNGCMLVAFAVEFIAAYLLLHAARFGLPLEIDGAAAILTIVVTASNSLLQRTATRNDYFLKEEIKRRLEQTLVELFMLESPEDTSIQAYMDWRDSYLAKTEETYRLTDPTQLWIDAVKKGRLPLAGAYRHKYGDKAAFVDLTMQAVLTD